MKRAVLALTIIFFLSGFTFAFADDDEETPDLIHGITDDSGTVYAPTGDGGFVNTETGTVYAPAGDDGVVNTKTGEYVPVAD